MAMSRREVYVPRRSLDRKETWVGIDAIVSMCGGLDPLSAKGNAEREGFEPSMGVSTHTAFPGLGPGVQGGAPAGTTYSKSRDCNLPDGRTSTPGGFPGCRAQAPSPTPAPASWAG